MSGAGGALPVGYTVLFDPTDEQLLAHYLLHYHHQNTIPACPAMQIENVYSRPPDDLLAGHPAGYFLASRPRKHRRGSRVCREAGNGSSWKQQKVEQILGGQDGRRVIGWKTLFYHGGFVLQEYELSADLSVDADKVLCKISRCNKNKRKSSSAPESAPLPAKRITMNINSGGGLEDVVFGSGQEARTVEYSWEPLNDNNNSFCDVGASSSMNHQGFDVSYFTADEFGMFEAGTPTSPYSGQSSELQQQRPNIDASTPIGDDKDDDEDNGDKLSSGSCTDPSKLSAMTRIASMPEISFPPAMNSSENYVNSSINREAGDNYCGLLDHVHELELRRGDSSLELFDDESAAGTPRSPHSGDSLLVPTQIGDNNDNEDHNDELSRPCINSSKLSAMRPSLLKVPSLVHYANNSVREQQVNEKVAIEEEQDEEFNFHPVAKSDDGFSGSSRFEETVIVLDEEQIQIQHGSSTDAPADRTDNMVEEAAAVHLQNEPRRNWISRLISKFSWSNRKNE